MEKLKMHTPDLAEENYKKLAGSSLSGCCYRDNRRKR